VTATEQPQRDASPWDHGAQRTTGRTARAPAGAPSPLVEPDYGWANPDGSPHRPSFSEAVAEWLTAIDFVHDPKRIYGFVTLLFHLATLGAFATFLLFHLSVGTVVFFLVSAVLLVTAYNTLWLHRFCVHHAFDFARPGYTRLFLWTNPLGFREESYIFAHHRHHERADAAGDPYGPHLGWWGSYLAIESIQKFDSELSRDDYAVCVRRIRHIGLAVNDHETYRRHAAIERAGPLVLRTLFAQVLWAAPIWAWGGTAYLCTWYAAIFLVMFAMRSFNYWGHGHRDKIAGFEFPDRRSLALNQRVYGWLASEWHNNHHRYPRSACYSFFPGQPDLAFLMIRGLHRAGIVAGYRDDREGAPVG